MYVRIGLPAYRSFFDVRTGISLVQIALSLKARDWKFEIQMVDNPDIHHARNTLMMEALASEAEWLLSLDYDSYAPGHQIVRMLETADAGGIALVAAPLPSRGGGINITTRQGEVYAKIDGKDVFPVDRIGFGIVGFNLKWMRQRWPFKEGPWFTSFYGPRCFRVSEDFLFCDQIKDLGGIVACDSRVEGKHETTR